MAASNNGTSKPRGKKTAAKNTTAKKTSSKASVGKSGGRKRTSKGSVKQKTVSREIWAIFYSAVGILFILSIYFENGAGFIGKPIRTVFLGTLGFGAYALPLVVIFVSVFVFLNKEYEFKLSKVFEGLGAFINLITFVHMLSFDSSKEYESFAVYVGAYFSNGAISNGGLIGAVFGNFFLRFFGKFGAFLIVIIIFIALGIALTDKPLLSLVTGFISYIKEMLADRSYETEEDEYIYEDDAYEEAAIKPRLTKKKDPIYDLPPITTITRKKPSNIIIENRKKQVEEKILIFNKVDKPVKKPILMPPTRKGIVNVITLNTLEDTGQKELVSKEMESKEMEPAEFLDTDFDLRETREEVYVETPLIKHYERRSFTEPVPFSSINYAHVVDETEDLPEDMPMIEMQADEIMINEMKVKQIPITEETHVMEEIQAVEETQALEEMELKGYVEEAYEEPFKQSADSILLEEEDAFEQKLQEQELNALLMATTGPLGKIVAETKREAVEARKPIPEKKPLPPVEKRVEKTSGFNISVIKHEDYVFPPISLLNNVPVNPNSLSRTQILETSKKLEDTLKSFGVEAKVVEVSKGPTVTRYELSPGSGVKVSKISSLSDDLALNLAAEGIRIEAPIPGKSVVGIEVPNKEVTPVYLREVIDDEIFKNYPSKLAFALGKDIAGNTVVTDIAKMPHLLIAGATGSGKSVCINTLVTSIIYKANPDDVKLLMIDPKVVELNIYNGIPHLLIPVVTDPKKAAGALNWAVQEMLARYNAFADTNVRDLKGYNAIIKERGEGETMPQIVIIIDELADLMMAAPGEVEDSICRLAQMARAAGLHLIIATQRPSVDVITGVIKANVPSRLAFSVSSGTDSRTILDMVGAEKLLGKGDMLFCPMGTSKPMRVQGAFISERETEGIVNFVKQGVDHEYDTDIIAKITASKVMGDGGGDIDEFFDEAIEFIIQKEKASASMLQRQFRIGYNRASRLIEEFEARGIIGTEDGSKPRKVLMTSVQWEEYKANR